MGHLATKLSITLSSYPILTSLCKRCSEKRSYGWLRTCKNKWTRIYQAGVWFACGNVTVNIQATGDCAPSVSLTGWVVNLSEHLLLSLPPHLLSLSLLQQMLTALSLSLSLYIVNINYSSLIISLLLISVSFACICVAVHGRSRACVHSVSNVSAVAVVILKGTLSKLAWNCRKCQSIIIYVGLICRIFATQILKKNIKNPISAPLMCNHVCWHSTEEEQNENNSWCNVHLCHACWPCLWYHRHRLSGRKWQLSWLHFRNIQTLSFNRLHHKLTEKLHRVCVF